jgi:hypothetical protein
MTRHGPISKTKVFERGAIRAGAAVVASRGMFCGQQAKPAKFIRFERLPAGGVRAHKAAAPRFDEMELMRLPRAIAKS